MFNNESVGQPPSPELLKDRNGYYIGKQWLGVTVNMWKEDLSKRNLFLFELYGDPSIPEWYLDREFGDTVLSRARHARARF